MTADILTNVLWFHILNCILFFKFINNFLIYKLDRGSIGENLKIKKNIFLNHLPSTHMTVSTNNILIYVFLVCFCT